MKLLFHMCFAEYANINAQSHHVKTHTVVKDNGTTLLKSLYRRFMVENYVQICSAGWLLSYHDCFMDNNSNGTSAKPATTAAAKAPASKAVETAVASSSCGYNNGISYNCSALFGIIINTSK